MGGISIKLKQILIVAILLTTILSLGFVSAADDLDDANALSDVAVTDVDTAIDDTVIDTVDDTTVDAIDTTDTEPVDISDSDTVTTDDSDETDLPDQADDVASDQSVNSKNTLNANALGADEVGTLSELYDLVKNGGSFTLAKDYAYNPSTDSNLISGMLINETLTLNGNGHTIDGGNNARLFILGGYTSRSWGITTYHGYTYNFNNITFINAKTTVDAGAVISSHVYPNVVSISNCNFTNNVGNRGAISVSVQNSELISPQVDDGSVTIVGSIFENNFASDRGGAIYSGISNGHSSITVRNSVFVNNTASGYAQAIYYVPNYAPSVDYNWWGQNNWNNNFVANSNNNYLTPTYRYQASLSQTGSNTVRLNIALNEGTVPSGSTLPARNVTSFSIGSGAINATGPVTANYVASTDTTITAKVDTGTVTLRVYKSPKWDITQLTATVDDTLLPNVPTLQVTASVDGTYDVVVGSKTYTVTVTNGQGSTQLTGLDVGSYVAIVSRTNDPIYNDKYAFDSFNVEKDNVTITVTATPTEVEYGTPITLSSTLNNTAATAGTTTYYIDGTATTTTLNLPVGEYTVIAKYTGDPNFNDAESAPVTIKVNKATPIITITSDAVAYPADAIVNFELTNANNAALPGVTLRVTINGVTYAVETNGEGKANLTVKGLKPNEYPIEAISVANENYASATYAGAAKVVVEKANATVTVSANKNEIKFGETVTLTTGLLPADATGDITIYVDGDVASTTLTGLSLGEHTVVAKYAGNDYYNAADSEALTITVNKADIEISTEGAEVNYPDKGTLTITTNVAGNYTIQIGQRTYTKEFVAGENTFTLTDVFDPNTYDILVTADIANYNKITAEKIGTYKVNKGVVTITAQGALVTYPEKGVILITSDVLGTYNITIGSKTYENVMLSMGENRFEVTDIFDAGVYDISVSSVETEKFAPVNTGTIATYTVEKATLSISLSVDDNDVEYGDSVIFDSEITAPEGATLASAVKYYIDGVEGTSPVNDLSVGTHTLVAKYTGDSNFNDAESTAVTITVNKATPVITITSDPVAYPNNAIVNIALSNSNNVALPGVTLRVTVNGTTYAVVTDSEGKASLKIAGLKPGEYPIAAVSVADDNYASAPYDGSAKVIVEKANATVTVSADKTEIKFGETVTLTTGLLPADATGDITIYVDDAVAGTTLSDLSLGEHTVVAKYAGNDYYNAADSEALTITVNKADIEISTEGAEVNYPNKGTLTITTNVAGTYTIQIGQKTYTPEFVAGENTFEIPDVFDPNTYDILVTADISNYNKITAENIGTYKVNKGIVHISAEDVTVTHPEMGTFVFNCDVIGDYNITIGNKTYEDVHFSLGENTFRIDYLFNGGEYEVSVSSVETEKYAAFNYTVAYYTVNKCDVSITVNVSGNKYVITYGEAVLLTASTNPWGAVGSKTYIVDGVESDEYYFDNLSVGTHTIAVRFHENVFYNGAISETKTITVNKATPEIAITSEPVDYPNDAVVNFEVTGVETAALPGVTLRVTVNGVNYAVVTDEEGKASLTIKGLDANTYDMTVVSVETDNYKSVSDDTHKVIVNQAQPTVTITPTKETYDYGENVVIDVTVRNGQVGINGTLTVTIGEDNHPVTIINGIGKLTLEGLASGSYDVAATFPESTNYKEATGSASFVVKSSADAVITASISDPTSAGETTLSIGFVDGESHPITGAINVTVDGVTTEYPIENGATEIPITGLGLGEHTIVVSTDVYDADPVSLTAVVPAKKGTYTDLQTQINNAEAGSTINLDYDIVYDAKYDGAAFLEGMTINKDISIEGANGVKICGNDLARVFKVTNNAKLTLDYLDICDGAAEKGAGIYVEAGASLNANIVFFLDNVAVYRGGAVYSEGTVNINNSIIRGNDITFRTSSDDNGGAAVYNLNGVLNIEGSVIEKNLKDIVIRDGNNGDLLVGVVVTSGETTIKDTWFKNNTGSWGGAISSLGYLNENPYTLTVTGSEFEGNNATFGGAIFVESSNLVVDDCIFTENAGVGEGSPGTSSTQGGAIVVFPGAAYAKITNSKFDKNSADAGGAVSLAGVGQNSLIEGCTFTDNTADDGGAVYLWTSNDAVVTVKNSTFSGNTANWGNAISIDGDIILERNTISSTSADIANWAGSIKSTMYVFILGNDTTEGSGIVPAQVGDEVTITAVVTDDNGNLIKDVNFKFAVNNGENTKTISATYRSESGKYEAPYTIDMPGNHVVSIINTVSDVIVINPGLYEVAKGDVKLTVTVENIKVGEKAKVDVKLTDEAETGLAGIGLTVIVNGVEYPITTDENGEYSLEIKGLEAGDYEANAIFAGNYNYNSAINKDSFKVTIDSEITVKIDDITFSEDAIIKVTLEDEGRGLTGIVIVSIGDDDYEVAVVAGEGEKAVSGLNAGTYTYSASFVGEGVYNPVTTEDKTFTVSPLYITIDIATPDIGVGTTGFSFIRLNVALFDEDGNLITDYDKGIIGEDVHTAIDLCYNDDYTQSVYIYNVDVDGFAEVDLEGTEALPIGQYHITATLRDSNYRLAVHDPIWGEVFDFKVTKNYLDSTVEGPEDIEVKDEDTHTIIVGHYNDDEDEITPADFNGNAIVKVYVAVHDEHGWIIPYTDDGEINPVYEDAEAIKNITVEMNNGEGALSFKELPIGDYVYAMSLDDDTYDAYYDFNVVVLPKEGTYTDLLSKINDAIRDAEDGETPSLSLEYDFAYSEEFDGENFPEGIVIDQDIIIRGNGFSISGSDSHRIFKVTDGAELSLDNLDIKDGAAEKGAGVYVDDDARLNAFEVHFTDNVAKFRGGAIYSEGDVFIYDSQIRDNDITFREVNDDNGGAAIYNLGGSLIIKNTIIKDNLKDITIRDGNDGDLINAAIVTSGDTEITNCEISKNSGSYGGGIYVFNGATLDVKESRFEENMATFGAAIYGENANVIIDNCDFNNNHCEGTGSSGTSSTQGSAVLVSGSSASARISNARFYKNIADVGGAISISASTMDNIIDNCEFHENIANEYGGAIYAYTTGDGTVTLTQSIFDANSAAYGGAIFAQSDLGLDKCEFNDNEAVNYGGAMYISGTADIDQTSFTNNQAQYGGALFLGNAEVSITLSTFEDNEGIPLVYHIYKGSADTLTIEDSYFATVVPSINAETSYEYGDEISIEANFDWGVNRMPISIEYLINGEKKTATVTNGKFTIAPEGLTVGTYTLVISSFTDEDGNRYEVDSCSKTFEVSKATPVISVTGVTVKYPADATIEITVSNDDEEALAGVTVNVTVDNVDYAIVTNEDGKASLTVKGLDANEEGYAISAVSIADDNYKSAVYSGNEKIIVLKADDVGLTVELVDNQLVISLTGQDNIPLDGTVNVAIDDGEAVPVSITNGKGTLDVSALTAGEHTVTAVSEPTDNYNSKTVTETIVVSGAPNEAIITVSVDNIVYGEDAVVSVTFTDKNGNPLQDTLRLTIGDTVKSIEIGEDGTGSVSVSDLVAGHYTAVVSFAGNETYQATSKEAGFDVAKLKTSIESEDITVYATVGSEMVFTLKDAKGNVMLNKDIVVAFNGQTYSLNTGETGEVRVPITMANKGTYSISASYAGDKNTEAAFATYNVIVKAKSTKLATAAATYSLSEAKYLTATLTAGGEPLANKIVTFQVNGKTYTGRTNAEGVVKVAVALTAKKTYSVVATFGGDNTYGTAVSTYKLKVV